VFDGNTLLFRVANVTRCVVKSRAGLQLGGGARTPSTPLETNFQDSAVGSYQPSCL